MDIKEFVCREQVRGDCFRLLSACYYQPEKELFLQDGILENLESSLKEISPDASVFAGGMKTAFSISKEVDLNVDYAKLFVGPNELLAPPFGSVYLDGERKVMGDSTMEVIKMYEAHGLSMDREFGNLPDHITVELEFMYYLIYREIEALEKSDIAAALSHIKAQELFLSRFLRPWIEPFCNNLRAGADSGYYRSLADCTLSFVMVFYPGDAFPEELLRENVQV
ncbi:MAG: molecular chaperone TorD family protein [Nitrospirae bacterium]|nr:molecular chaperone TorD family protein [Nitrospirota bacterium]